MQILMSKLKEVRIDWLVDNELLNDADNDSEVEIDSDVDTDSGGRN